MSDAAFDPESLRDGFRDVLEREVTSERLHRFVDSGELRDGALWSEAAALGWPALAIPEEHGGLGLSMYDEARLVMVDDHTVDIPPARHMVVVRNDDRPGMIGLVGSTLGKAGINISDMDVGRSPSGVAALMVLSTDRALPAEVHAELSAAEGILHVATVDQE